MVVGQEMVGMLLYLTQVISALVNNIYYGRMGDSHQAFSPNPSVVAAEWADPPLTEQSLFGESESGLGSIDGGVVVGGRGGAGGDAGSVEIKSMGEKITTKADFSSGIQAVSVGGGGGTGGSARSKSSNYGTATNNLSVVLGGDGSGGGDGKEVTITNRSIIKTGGRDQTRRGQHSFGIFGQSVGGGGGNGGSSSTDNTSIEIGDQRKKRLTQSMSASAEKQARRIR